MLIKTTNGREFSIEWSWIHECTIKVLSFHGWSIWPGIICFANPLSYVPSKVHLKAWESQVAIHVQIFTKVHWANMQQTRNLKQAEPKYWLQRCKSFRHQVSEVPRRFQYRNQMQKRSMKSGGKEAGQRQTKWHTVWCAISVCHTWPRRCSKTRSTWRLKESQKDPYYTL